LLDSKSFVICSDQLEQSKQKIDHLLVVFLCEKQFLKLTFLPVFVAVLVALDGEVAVIGLLAVPVLSETVEELVPEKEVSVQRSKKQL
jgi:hypothetical protein